MTLQPGSTDRRLRVVVVTRLFPNAAEPMNAVYNRLQCLALSRLCELDVRAVIPWFPGASLLGKWSSAGRCARVPARETFDGMEILHPRVLFVPRIGAVAGPGLYTASLWPHLRKLRGKVDVVVGCWAFPDGVAAIALARLLGAGSAVKVHGSDLNVLAEREPARSILRWALPRAGRVVAVSRPLAEKAVALGVAPERVEVVRNGIDRALFRVRDRATARAELGLDQSPRWILYVGLLDRRKGILDLLDAFARLAPQHPDLNLAVVGEGPELPRVREAAEQYGSRLVFTGALPLDQVARWISACDVLTLPSWNEGIPNVVVEAFASGRPVVATRVGGIPDVVTSPELGILVPPRDVRALADALARVAARQHDEVTLSAAAPGGWPESAARLLEVLQATAQEAGTPGAILPASR